MACSAPFCNTLYSIFIGLSFAQENNHFPNDSAIGGQGSQFFFYEKPGYPRDCSEVSDFCESFESSGVYLIKPDGFEEPFEAYCDNEINSGGWTRNWSQYKRGFGFLWTEFWFGNDKVASLTNQAVYELRIDITLANGTSCEVKYNAFRISDEWSDYTISAVGTYESDLACKWKEGSELPILEESNSIDDSVNFTDCDDVYNAGYEQDGVYFIRPTGWNGPSFQVFCNMSIDFGSWLVFQPRVNGSTDFSKSWVEYREGFGDIRHEFWLGNRKLHHLTQQAMYECRLNFVYGSSSYYHKYSSIRIDSETNKYCVAELGSVTRGSGIIDILYYIQNIPFSTHDQDNDGQIYHCAEGHGSGWWHGGFFQTCNFAYADCRYFRHRDIGVLCSYANPNGDYNGRDDGKKIFHSDDRVDICAENFQYIEMKIRRIFTQFGNQVTNIVFIGGLI